MVINFVYQEIIISILNISFGEDQRLEKETPVKVMTEHHRALSQGEGHMQLYDTHVLRASLIQFKLVIT